MYGWNFTATFFNASGVIVGATDTAELANLQWSYKLNGGDASASFELTGQLQRRFRWLTGNPDGVEMLITSPGGVDMWRGRFLAVTVTPERRSIIAQFVGYWATLRDRHLTHTWTAGTPTTLGVVIGYASANGLMPGIVYDAAFLADPGVDFTPGGGHDLVADHEPVQSVFTRLAQVGDGGQQFHLAVWSDKKLRVFRRDLTLDFQVWTSMIQGQAAQTMSRATMISHITAPYRDAAGAQQWTGYVPDATAEALLGTRRDGRISNPFETGAIATALAQQYLFDHSKPIDEGHGFAVGPVLYNAYGGMVPSYNIRPGHVIRIVDLAFASTAQSGVADNKGTYYVLEVGIDPSTRTVSITPDAPASSLANLLGGAV